jgi:hypothetical protein
VPKRQSYRKGSKKKPQRKKFLIVVEGVVTECDYMNAIRRSLRLSSVTIEIATGYTDPVGIVNSAKKLRKSAFKSDPYDEVWCVFDVEAKVTQQARHGLAEAIDSAKRSKISVAISNPCFEIWLLWHKESREGYTTSDVAQRRCQEIGITDADDGKDIQDVDNLVLNHYEAAKERASNMEAAHDRNLAATPEVRNPSSGVFKLVDAIFAAFPPRK